MAIPIFAIFQGGGARGIAHIGAVAACEKDFYFVGVAGTSAGAIVACLLAAGYAASDILDPEAVEENILANYGMTPVQLLGPEWSKLNEVNSRRTTFDESKTWFARFKSGIALAICGWPVLRDAWPAKGVMSTSHVRELLNRALRDRLLAVREDTGDKTPVPERIRFEDLNPEAKHGEFLPLKIITTNLTKQAVTIFSQELTPKVEVAEAVAASIAIPGAFRPVEIELDDEVQRFVDGGLVSNLPSWVFANEKLAFERAFWRDPPVPIVGFTLTEEVEKPAGDGDGVLRFVARLGGTTLSASQSVSQLFVQDLLVAPLATSLRVLDFGASEIDLLAAYHAGESCAAKVVAPRLIIRPREARALLEEIHDKARRDIVAMLPVGERRERWKLRANVVETPDGQSFRVTFGHNMKNDADDRLPLDERGRGAPAAFRAKDLMLTHVGPAWNVPEKDYMTKYERALVPPGVRSIISIPIFPDRDSWNLPLKNRPVPCGVLSLDASRDLAAAFNDNDFMSSLVGQSVLLWPILTREPPVGENH